MTLLQETINNDALTHLQVSFLQKIEACSPFLARLLSQSDDVLNDVLAYGDTTFSIDAMQAFLAVQVITDEASLQVALRKLRQYVIARIIWRDLNGLADFSEVVRIISEFADFSINTALGYLHGWQVAKYGEPVDVHGVPQSLVVIGMGKLGGMELNVSSDVDLIFAYEQDGETCGEKSIANQDYFVRLGKKLIAALDEPTADGFVFRVDMRLRPFGNEGVLVSSLDALEAYYQNNGREWERYAWIKGREVTGGNAVSKLLKPFVYRKYLDYNAFASMRDLKVQIQRDVNVQSAKATGGKDNIKLGRGGIREVEFIAQVFQLIRGGQEPNLQIRPTLQVLALLKEKRLLPADAADSLRDAYVFLRNVEHRLMYMEDAQSQDLPKSEAARACVATAMGFDQWSGFMSALNYHRDIVRLQFDQTFSLDKNNPDKKGRGEAEEGTALAVTKSIWDGELDDAQSLAALEKLGFNMVDDTLKQIQLLHQGHHYKQLPELSRQRFNQLLPVLIEVASRVNNPDIALMRTMDFIDAICRRASYLALLAEYPSALGLVVRLCGASAWCAQYLTQHPIVLDELLDEVTLYAAPDFAALRREMEQTMQALDGDVEQQMNAMRHFKQAAIFRFISQDITGQLPLEILSDHLSALADLIVDVSIQTIWQSLSFKHIAKPKFAVIGYGKLGGKELGYVSDLDIIFLFKDDADDAGSIYARFAQRISSWFNSVTPAGMLYETDLQLRPDGNSGLLVSSTKAFQEYQSKRAWGWEHQAITRARFIAGDTQIGEIFEAIRSDVMQQYYVEKTVVEKLRLDVVEMREKMRHAQRFTVDLFDLKQSQGGIIDVEFIVQYLVLAHAAKHDALTANIGNIALLAKLGDLGIIDATLAQQSADAYRAYRRLQHAARMQGDMQPKVEHALVEQHAKAVVSLWNSVLLAD